MPRKMRAKPVLTCSYSSSPMANSMSNPSTPASLPSCPTRSTDSDVLDSRHRPTQPYPRLLWSSNWVWTPQSSTGSSAAAASLSRSRDKAPADPVGIASVYAADDRVLVGIEARFSCSKPHAHRLPMSPNELASILVAPATKRGLGRIVRSGAMRIKEPATDVEPPRCPACGRGLLVQNVRPGNTRQCLTVLDNTEA